MKTNFAKSAAYTMFLVGSLFLISACETAEDRSLAAGQACLDGASTAADADRCVALVQGINTPAAYSIKCAAHFIAQGFTGARIASAVDRMKNNSTPGTDPMISIMSYLVFSNTNATHSEDAAVADCAASGVASLGRLADLAKLATMTVKMGGLNLTNFDPATVDTTTLANNMKNAITQMANSGSAADQAAAGNVVLNLNSTLCSAGSTFKDKEACTYIGQAISGTNGTPAAIGQALFNILKNK